MHILSAEYVVPISSPPIKNGAVAIDNDKIAAVGPAADLIGKYPSATHENFGDAAILPGFVNCHSHLEITAMRGFLDDVEHDFRSWLLKLNATREQLTTEDIETGAIAGALEGARAGVTCFGDIGRYGRVGLAALKAVGLRGVVFQETEFSPDNATAERDSEQLREKFGALRSAAADLIEIGISPHSPYTVSRKLFEKIAEFALAEAIKITIHAAESRDEDELVKNGRGFFIDVYEKFGLQWDIPRISSIEFLNSTGILTAKPLLAHCITVSDSDVALIAESGSSITHCPKSNAKFGHGYAPLEAFLDAGISVGLGSDSVASNNVCDLMEESRFAALAARNRAGSTRFITAAEILEAATLGGAKALGLDNKVGTLEAGKQADIAVVSLENTAQQPVHDVHTALVFASNARDVLMTIVAGREIYRDGRCDAVDETRIAARMKEIMWKTSE